MPQAADMLRLDLPFPPSTNTYWRHNRGRIHISEHGQVFREHVKLTVRKDQRLRLNGPLAILIDLYPPDRRERDIDNFSGKALFDALQYAGVIENDSQIEVSLARKWGRVAGGKTVVVIAQNPEPTHEFIGSMIERASH